MVFPCLTYWATLCVNSDVMNFLHLGSTCLQSLCTFMCPHCSNRYSLYLIYTGQGHLKTIAQFLKQQETLKHLTLNFLSYVSVV